MTALQAASPDEKVFAPASGETAKFHRARRGQCIVLYLCHRKRETEITFRTCDCLSHCLSHRLILGTEHFPRAIFCPIQSRE